MARPSRHFPRALPAWREGCGTFREHSPLGARVAELSASTLRLARPSRHFPRALPAWREGRGTFREHPPIGETVAALSASTPRLARGSRHFPRALPAWREGCGTFRDRLSRATGPCGISRDRHSRFRHQSFKVVPASADAVPSRVPARHLGLRGSAAPRQAVSPSLFRSTGGGRPLSMGFDIPFIFALDFVFYTKGTVPFVLPMTTVD